jgi:exodeoxyribonuclease VIII
MGTDLNSLDFPIGLRHGLGIEEYHAGPGISKTGLDDIDRSPAIFHALHLDPSRPTPKERPGQLEGDLTHCATLEPAEIKKRYAISAYTSRATKEWKAWEASLPPGLTAIKSAQYGAAMRQAESIRRLPEVREALERGRAEVSAYWADPETGVLCRCRPDWAHPCGESGVILLDVKTCGDASPREFARQAARKRYEVQDAFYSEGYGMASGLEVLAFIFVAVESEWPYAASAVMLADESRAAGHRAAHRNLSTYAQCLAASNWPGYGDAIQIINLPAWAINKEPSE